MATNFKTFGTFKRKFIREQKEIQDEFQDLVSNFFAVLFSYDWDSLDELFQYKVFEEYNRIWILFSEKWNTNERHVTKVNSFAFHQFAISQNEKDLENGINLIKLNEEVKSSDSGASF
jgi:hypothetical protein